MQDAAYDVQVRLVDHMVEARQAPIVVDSRELLLDPRSVLTQLCARLGIPFEVGDAGMAGRTQAGGWRLGPPLV